MTGPHTWTHASRTQPVRLFRHFGVLGITLVVGILVACGGDDDAEAAAEPTATPTIEDRRAEVVRELRSLMQIETSIHSVETVVEAEADSGWFSSDRLLLVAHGQVTAGVDLTNLGEVNVEVTGHDTVRVTLPNSEILTSEMNEDKTQVVSRDTGLFSSEDEDLEDEAIEEAQEKILQSACDHEILERAASEAETRIANLLSLLGFENITVVGEAGSCP